MIYLDNAATTKMDPEVLNCMMPYFMEEYGNASSIYHMGADAKKAVMAARRSIAQSIQAEPNEIFFTSGGTEANNWALVTTAETLMEKGRHIITTKIEHPAILNTCRYLEKRGFTVTYLGVDQEGQISLEELQQAIRKDTILISVMYANNEIGSLQPIDEIGRIAKEHDILFHTDAVQAYGHKIIDVKSSNIDLMSTSAHKLNGPKGVGFLYIRNTIPFHAFLHGGAQERGRRAGTENVAGIVGYGKAVELSMQLMPEREKKIKAARDYLIKKILREIPETRLNGGKQRRLSNNVNFSFKGVRGETLVIMLDREDICISSGSACASGATEPSHVLTAIGLSASEAYEAVRMTIGHENTLEEMDEVVRILKEKIQEMRKIH